MRRIEPNSKGQDDKVRVTFSMPGSSCRGDLYLIGWFDEWDESVYRMQRTAEGNWSLTLELEPDCEYQYCFRTADGRWLQDPNYAAELAESRPTTSFVISRDRLSRY